LTKNLLGIKGLDYHYHLKQRRQEQQGCKRDYLENYQFFY